MNIPDSSILATRCLNETRLLHPPTYIGARYLADSLISDSGSSLAVDSILRKYPLQKNGRFHSYLRYKKLDENGMPEYRQLLIPSPWTGLAEAVVLSSLGSSAVFSKPANVYSYIWPKHPGCPYNYEHYYNGYEARNRTIAEHFVANPGDIALVADIERFYPSIRHDRLLPQFAKRLETSGLSDNLIRSARRLVEHLTAEFPRGTGIPTGPALSPMLADVSLASIDEAMIRKYGNRYFRYVDDFVFVVPPGRIDEAQKDLSMLLEAEGLVGNPGKDDIVSSDRWLSHGPRTSIGVVEHSFEALVFQLKAFLTAHPGQIDELSRSLFDAGFNLPLGRMLINAQRVSFRKRVTYLLRRGWKVAWSAVISDTKTLVEYAAIVRERHIDRLKSLTASTIPESGVQRRWHVQRVRYVANRLLYLLPFSELGLLDGAIASLPEFRETAALLELLLRRNINPLLEMPGPAVGAASGLLGNNGTPRQPVQLPSNLSEAGVHSASVFLLYGVASVTRETLGALSESDRELLLFCAGEAPTLRTATEARYIDELRTLQLNQPQSDRMRLLSERYSESETAELEALDIGEDHFS